MSFLRSIWCAIFGCYRGWRIGPVIKGKNYSVGVPERIVDGFDFPQPIQTAGHVHYVTRDCGALAGTLRLRYRIDGEAEFRAKDYPAQKGTICLYFQRKGDDWSAKGEFETYRWYAGFAYQELAPGEHEIAVDLNDPRWGAILTSNAASAPRAFAEAKLNAGRVGFVIGGGDGWGHGAYATAPARFTILEFSHEGARS